MQLVFVVHFRIVIPLSSIIIISLPSRHHQLYLSQYDKHSNASTWEGTFWTEVHVVYTKTFFGAATTRTTDDVD